MIVVNAVINDNMVTFRVMLGFADGSNIMQEKVMRDVKECHDLGLELAETMIDNGALDLLKKAENLAFKDEMPQRL